MSVDFQSIFVGFDASFGVFRPPSMCVQHYRSTKLIALGFSQLFLFVLDVSFVVLDILKCMLIVIDP